MRSVAAKYNHLCNKRQIAYNIFNKTNLYASFDKQVSVLVLVVVLMLDLYGLQRT